MHQKSQADIDVLTTYADVTGITRQWVPTSIMPEVAYYAGKLGGEAAELFNAIQEQFPPRRDARSTWVPDKTKCGRELADVLWYFARICEAPEVGLKASPFLARAESFSAPSLEHFDHTVVLMYVCGVLQEAVFKNYRDSKRAVANIEEFGFLLQYVAWAIYRSAKRLGFSLADIARLGIEKQKQRIANGTVGGSGSDR